MFELVQAGGWLMAPIITCSVISVAICFERFWSLRSSQILPKNLLAKVLNWIKNNELDAKRFKSLRNGSPLGKILAAGVMNHRRGRDGMKVSLEEAANDVIHDLERYLNTLGTVAAISPLLGLLGTVIGMIKVFTTIKMEGTGNSMLLAGGISEALITTAAGLTVAIPSLFFHRFFQRRVDKLVIDLEQESLKLVEIMQNKDFDLSDASRYDVSATKVK
ncbi:MAG: MotA/TolQ/ExbB proton channel family protein [Gammaproteobacteria bacterium TMED1]|nr:MAG: MotA/TolQ/ExbB proton channel family protein [Gammaproteobacteria bacterium TMED1]